MLLAKVRRYKRRLVGFALAIVLSLGLFTANFSIELFQYDRLLAAREEWDSSGINNYRAVVAIGNYSQIAWYEVVVRNGELTAASSRPGLLAPDTHPFQPVALEEAADYTIDALFDRADRAMEHVPRINITSCAHTKYEVDFDPDLGYIKLFTTGCGGGWWGCAISHCRASIRVLEFEVLDRPG